jgi:hypothetical protein
MKNRSSRAAFMPVSAAIFCISITISACDSGSKVQSNSAAASLTTTAPVILYGQIRGDDGAFESGSLTATDFSGKLVARTQWQDDKGNYTVEIPAGAGFPVLLTAKAKQQGSKSETLVAAVISPNLTKHDITPNSTKVAEKAKSLGGYTKENMMQATLDTVNRPKGDRTVGGFRGDPTKQFGGWH